MGEQRNRRRRPGLAGVSEVGTRRVSRRGSVAIPGRELAGGCVGG